MYHEFYWDNGKEHGNYYAGCIGSLVADYKKPWEDRADSKILSCGRAADKSQSIVSSMKLMGF